MIGKTLLVVMVALLMVTRLLPTGTLAGRSWALQYMRMIYVAAQRLQSCIHEYMI